MLCDFTTLAMTLLDKKFKMFSDTPESGKVEYELFLYTNNQRLSDLINSFIIFHLNSLFPAPDSAMMGAGFCLIFLRWKALWAAMSPEPPTGYRIHRRI
jgi:hypothetical protein